MDESRPIRLLRSIPALPVQNMQQAVAFYRDRLGFLPRHQAPGFAILVRDEVELHLWEASDEAWRSRAMLSARPVVSGAESFIAGTASCRIQVHGIDRLFAEYAARGVLYGPDTVVESTPWGDREFPALDHERNLLTFFESG